MPPLNLLISVLGASLQAHTLIDPVIEALHVADKRPELQHAAAERLATRPDDAQAVLAIAPALAAMIGSDDTAARGKALDQARGCAGLQRRDARCRYGLGLLLGVRVGMQGMSEGMSEGMISMARSTGTVKTALPRRTTSSPPGTRPAAPCWSSRCAGAGPDGRQCQPGSRAGAQRAPA